ncbi:hypothetical protein ACFOEK_20700 [Litoribrevibacter euphylliae]|uniref:Uncharacterized protein n=1 Tax=Litoribrevibacter euphylliae TaxID=1834034 RepID=A0ABV7HLI4_9GAMM
MNFNQSEKVGIVVGIILGVAQVPSLINQEMFPVFPDQLVLQVLLFGLLAPLVLAFITKLVFKPSSPFMSKVSSYVNVFFLMVAFGLSCGFTGVCYHLIFGLPDHTLMPIVFFGASGIGFLGAYFINPELAYRVSSKA